MPDDPMNALGVDLIPEPRDWSAAGSAFSLGGSVQIAVPDGADEADRVVD